MFDVLNKNLSSSAEENLQKNVVDEGEGATQEQGVTPTDLTHSEGETAPKGGKSIESNNLEVLKKKRHSYPTRCNCAH